jgi:uncharacterized repeat protein (TIGR02543 family)
MLIALIFVFTSLFATVPFAGEVYADDPVDTASISGTVTNSISGVPLKEIAITLYKLNETEMTAEVFTPINFPAPIVTGADGKYKIENLAAGTYRVAFNEKHAAKFVPQFWKSATDFNKATDIIIPTPSAIIDIDAAIMPDYNVVTFDSTGGSAVAPINVTPSQAVGYLPTPVRSGYRFLGWYTASTGGVQVTAATVPASSVTYYAQWIALYTITFDANGGSEVYPNSVIVEAGQTVGNIPEEPTRAGYKFLGWYTAKSGGSKVSETTLPVKSQSYYARWVKVYKQTFKANGSNVKLRVTSKIIETKKKIGELPEPTRAGYKFLGWYTDAKAGKKISAKTVITKANKYYAHWIPAYKVSWKANGGKIPSTYTMVPKVTKIGTLPKATRTGYKFLGWYTKSKGGQLIGSSTIARKNVSYSAHWSPKKYTVKFSVNGGKAISLKKRVVTFDTKYGTLKKTSRVGYKYGGWYLDKTYSKRITASSKLKTAKNHTLYVKWVPKKYLVTFDVNGGDKLASSTKKVTYDSAYGTLPIPTRTNKDFVGWFTKKKGGKNIIQGTKVKITAGQKLYAHWAKKKSRGIDVSYAQGNIDWAKVKASGIDFAIIRVGYIGNVDHVVDKFYAQNVINAKAAGIQVGAYIYVYSGNKTAMNKGLKIMHQAIVDAGVTMDLPVYLDIEDTLFLTNTGGKTTAGNKKRTKLVGDGMQKLVDYGYSSGLYTNPSWSKNYIDTVSLQESGWALWLAQWPLKNGAYQDFDPHSYSWFGTIQPEVWQYSSKGSVPGISGNVDMDYWIY